MEHGYKQSDDLRAFQLVRNVPAKDGGEAINVVVDFLRPINVDIARNRPPLIEKFAVQRADGAELALRFYQYVAVTGDMPGGGVNQVKIAVASIPALLAMKGFAIQNRLKRKDAYDIYYCVRNYSGGIEALAKDCRPVLAEKAGEEGFGYISGKFDQADGFGPTSVRKFVEETDLIGERTPDQWQQDAFGQVDALLRALGLRK